jgi:hypothetical protein
MRIKRIKKQEMSSHLILILQPLIKLNDISLYHLSSNMQEKNFISAQLALDSPALSRLLLPQNRLSSGIDRFFTITRSKTKKLGAKNLPVFSFPARIT